MKRILFTGAVLGSILALALLFGACYSPMINPNGSLSFNLQFPAEARGLNDYNAVIFVANADFEANIKELLFLLDKKGKSSLTSADDDRLLRLAQDVSQMAMVRFAGDPFFRATLYIPGGSSSGTIELPGVPAERSYFIKVLVFQAGKSLDDLTNLQPTDILYENRLFTPELYTTAWQSWSRSQTPLNVESGKSVDLNVVLINRI